MKVRKNKKKVKNSEILVQNRRQYKPNRDVPWFSCHEWLTTYENAFSDKFEDWKSAYDQMSVWKCRVPALPLGVESTMHLLSAEIASMNPELEETFKITILNMAITRFVSMITESRIGNHSMINKAEQMGLPSFLVNLRNRIVHSSNTYGIFTLHAALKSSLDWIKMHYWEAELLKKQQILNNFSPENLNNSKKYNLKSGSSIIKAALGSLRNHNSNLNLKPETKESIVKQITSSGKFDTLHLCIKKYFNKSLTTSREQISKALFTEMRISYMLYPKECTRFIICHILFINRTSVTDTRSHCRCLMGTLASRHREVVQELILIGASNTLLQEVIGLCEVNSSLCCLWLSLLLFTWLSRGDETKKERCPIHAIPLLPEAKKAFKVDWKAAALELLEAPNSNWACDMGLRIVDECLPDLDAFARNALKELVIKKQLADGTDVRESDEEQFFSVEDN